MSRYIVLHAHMRGAGGLGDFIRAALSIYSICCRRDIEYYISFEQNPNMARCFDYKKMPSAYNSYKTNLMTEIDREGSFTEKKFVRHIIRHPDEINILVTNIIGIETSQNIARIRDDFFTNILRINDHVIRIARTIQTNLNIVDNNYISVHVRCGDKFIASEKETSDESDQRITLSDKNDMMSAVVTIDCVCGTTGIRGPVQVSLFDQIVRIVRILNDKKLPVVIHSDSKIFKNNMHAYVANISAHQSIQNYTFIDLDACHLAGHIGEPDVTAYQTTVAEFYIMARAQYIVSPYTYSGFSHIASLVNDKILYTVINHPCYLLLNFNNIRYIDSSALPVE